MNKYLYQLGKRYYYKWLYGGHTSWWQDLIVRYVYLPERKRRGQAS